MEHAPPVGHSDEEEVVVVTELLTVGQVTVELGVIGGEEALEVMVETHMPQGQGQQHGHQADEQQGDACVAWGEQRFDAVDQGHHQQAAVNAGGQRWSGRMEGTGTFAR